MDAIECIKTRRSVRKYMDKDVPDHLIDEILDCAMKAPSAHNKQPWSFIVVKDKNKIKKLSELHQWSSFVSGAPVCIVVCLTKETKSDFQPSMYLSVAAAIQNMLLAIHSLGLSSCWTYLKDFEHTLAEDGAKKLLNIPDDVEAICMLPIGYSDQKIPGRFLKDKKDLVHFDKW